MLADDTAAVTYKAADKTIHQYIGTYGSRDGLSYYYVGPSIYGRWSGPDAVVIAGQQGIEVRQGGRSESFDWDQVVQFGTLAIVLVREGEARWTISLNENFKVQSESLVAPIGDITLYQATMEKNKPVKLAYTGQD